MHVACPISSRSGFDLRSWRKLAHPGLPQGIQKGQDQGGEITRESRGGPLHTVTGMEPQENEALSYEDRAQNVYPDVSR